MDSLKSVKAGGIAGIIFVVALVAISFLVPAPPAADAPAADSLDYLVDNRSAVMFQASLSTLPTFALFLFVRAFWKYLDDREQSGHAFSAAAIAGILLGWSVGVVLALMYGALAYLSETTLDASQARNLAILITVGYGGAVVFWGAASLFAGLVLAASGGAARWVGWYGVVAGIISAISVFGWADDGLFAAGGLMFVGYLANLLFLLAASVLLTRAR
jgi:hypothetical protein